MKKLSLIIVSLTSIIFAVSAQDGFFDIQKYMQKKDIEPKSADKLVLSKPSFKKPSTYLLTGRTKQKRVSHILSNGDKVYLLDQDNMPCIMI